MNPTELKITRMKRKVTGKEAAEAIGLSIDGYFKKEHGNAKITLAEAYVLTKLFRLTLTEFVDIFFDGNFPFLYDCDESFDFGGAVSPLKEARLRSGYSEEEVAEALGIKPSAYHAREKGGTRISLDQCYILSKLYRLSLQEFNDIFFASRLPFRNDCSESYKYIIPQKGAKINAEASNNSSL